MIGFPPGAEFELLGARLTILVWTVVGGDVAGEGGVVADTESDEESDGEEAEGVEDKEVVDRVGSLDVLVVISVVTVVIVVLMVVVEGCAGVIVEIIIGNIGVLSVDVGEIGIDVVESEVLGFVPNISLIRSIGIVCVSGLTGLTESMEASLGKRMSSSPSESKPESIPSCCRPVRTPVSRVRS